MSGQTAFTVTDQASLAAAITAVDLSGASSAPNTTYVINIASGAAIALTSDLPAINLVAGDSLAIAGNGATLLGNGSERGLLVYAGNVAIANLTITNTVANGGNGGSGYVGGGGGAGLGGGLFVAAHGSVALSGVTFNNNAAIGGNGGAGNYSGYGLGGGGGMGGPGGSGGGLSGGGGVGYYAKGAGSTGAGSGIVPRIPAVSAGAYTVARGGGGGGQHSGGGIGGNGPNGGFGGGGGAYGDGGFGGGSGAFGAQAGFGGGGAGGVHAGPEGFGGGAGGAGSYIQQAAGYGYYGPYYNSVRGPAAGGGGLGAGGNVFVQQGGVLAIGAGALLNGEVVAGAGGGNTPGITNAFALGSAIFLEGYETLFLSPALGQTLTIAGVIADQAGAGVGPTVQGSGTIVVSGGLVVLAAANTYTGPTVLDGGTLALNDAQAAGSGEIVFAAGVPGTLAITSGAPANPIADFAAGDTIVLASHPAAVAYDAAQHQLAYAGGTLNFDANTAPRAIAYAAATGMLTVACLAAGTRIATPRGPVAVERLRVGEGVVLAAGGTAPVVWLGHRRIDCRRHPRPDDVQPVRIAAHAFGLGRPAREVLLSPDHAVFMDDVLIPVRYLLNGATVAQVTLRAVTYWHVELPAHGVLLAEGLPVESYLDSGNRAAFANGGALVMAHADFARRVWTDRGCAPLVTAGAVVARLQARLIAQALALGWRPTDAGAGAVRWIAPGAASARPLRRRRARG